MANFSSASRQRLEVLGLVSLPATVVSYKTRVPLAVVRNFGADVLLGCMYIDKHVEALRRIKKHIQFKDCSIVPVLRRQEHPPIHGETTEPKLMPLPRAMKDFDAIPVARTVNILPISELITSVTVGQRELKVVEGRAELLEKRRLIVANCVTKLSPTEWFWVKVASLSEKNRQTTMP